MAKQLKTPIILAVICLILGITLTAVLLSRGHDDDNTNITDEQHTESLIATYPRGKVDYLRITTDTSGLSLKRSGDAWTYVADSSIPVDTETIVKLLNEFEVFSAVRTLDDVDNIAEYGLDDPSAVLLFTCSGNEHTITFGAQNAHYNGYYASVSGDNRVFIVDKRYFSALTATDYSILGLPSIPKLPQIDGVSFCYPSGERTEISPSDEPWLTSCINSIELTERIELTEIHDDSYGLESPVECRIAYDGGEYILLFGQDESKSFTYLRQSGSSAVYLFKADCIEKLIGYISQDR